MDDKVRGSLCRGQLTKTPFKAALGGSAQVGSVGVWLKETTLYGDCALADDLGLQPEYGAAKHGSDALGLLRVLGRQRHSVPNGHCTVTPPVRVPHAPAFIEVVRAFTPPASATTK